jgi:tRNA (mo5U34)-methyltransferase
MASPLPWRAVAIAPGTDEHQRMLRAALDQPWYHTIELEPGAVTPGAVDLRSVAPRVLPARLEGQRALDVGTFDGFWAFELERRGAEVLATDLERFDQTEWPPLNRAQLAAEAGDSGPGERFALAHQLLGSKVRKIVTDIYGLSTELLGGHVEYAVVGDLLIHLRDPVRGLEAVRSVLVPATGRLLLLEEVSVPLTLLRPTAAWASFQARGSRYNWWQANYRCLRDWLALAGFREPERRVIYKLDARGRQARWHVAFEARVAQ